MNHDDLDEHGTSVGDRVADPAILSQLERLANWSPWIAFDDAVASAPLEPGVYMAMSSQSGSIIYVGMAGERRGKGLRGRLRVYSSGKALTSGLGEAVFDRAIADPDWLRSRLAEAEAGKWRRARDWGRLSFDRADLSVRWATTSDRVAALALERACIALLANAGLWNRAQ